MRIPSRLINIAGTLLVLVALIAGTVLMALPVYLESFTLAAQKGDVAASNAQLQSRIDALHTRKAELPALEAELADLHHQLPPIPQLDDVTQLVVKAADKAGTAITSVEFGPSIAFEPRTTEAVLAGLPDTATGVPTEEPAGASGGATGTPDDADAAGTSGDVTATVDAPESQIPVTISVTAPDLAAATRFLDELRAGPRLFQPDSITGAQDADSRITVTITGLVFVRRTT